MNNYNVSNYSAGYFNNIYIDYYFRFKQTKYIY
jgi:hypothetical protein